MDRRQLCACGGKETSSDSELPEGSSSEDKSFLGKNRCLGEERWPALTISVCEETARGEMESERWNRLAPGTCRHSLGWRKIGADNREWPQTVARSPTSELRRTRARSALPDGPSGAKWAWAILKSCDP
ncbi:hypothetical protein SKAU_G00363350 [Synaphobranchus kaupii]|uniref:Uncharacterized protein n=1 Tax=Synaphobranchus kaupii TaxID=118154 RepID=A0A9Q1EIR9_SYNKA|nr:hypothetical protein SKAU_G00363350 [Synaphobranchus kaupii]